MRICLQRREFIAALGGVVALPLAARAQQPAGMRRIGVLMAGDENDPVQKPQVLLSRRRLRAWAGLMAATCGWTFVGPAMTPIGYEHSRRSWSACNCRRKLLSVNVFIAQGEPVPYNFPYKWQTRRRTLADKFSAAPLPAGAVATLRP